jgi:glutaredoxin
MHKKHIILIFSAVVILGALLHQPTTVQASSAANTRTSKAIHVCETVYLEPTPTETPYFCGAYCHEFAPETTTPTGNSTLQTETPSLLLPPKTKNSAAIYFFWGEGCPHCAVAKPFLQTLADNNAQTELMAFEVYYNAENYLIFDAMARAYGFEPRAVPTILIGEKYWEGFSDNIQNEIQQEVDRCLVQGCEDLGESLLAAYPQDQNANPTGTETPSPTLALTSLPSEAEELSSASEVAPSLDESASESIRLPLFGTIDLSSKSLFVSTLLISFVDGFNPCSIWVLSMLLALTLHTGSRKKVLFIGLIFLTVTAAIYGLFITGLFTIFKVISFVGWIQFAVALVALIFAFVNIKDYFWYKEGVSFTITDDKKPGIIQRIRKLMDTSQSYWGLAIGTIVLAAGVSLVEFSCTAGFPVLWTNLLISQDVTAATFILLLLVYLIVYQLDELAIFVTAVYTMRAGKMEEKHGRILKLIGGILMLALALVMLINPSLMNSLSSSLIIFAIAFGLTILVLFIHRILLPKFGIHIGTEFNKAKSSKRRVTK